MQVPEGWEVKKFGRIFNIKSGLGFKYSEYTESGIPLVKIDNVSHGYVSWDNLTFLPSNYCKKHADLLLDEGDVLLALNRPITQGELKIARVTSKDAPSILYQRVGKIFPLTSNTSNDYYYYVFQKEIFNFVQRNAVGSDQPFISTTELKKINLPAPPLQEQQKIAQILSAWDKVITTTEQLLTNSQQQKKALMQQLLTGKKRLLDDNGQRFGGEWKQVVLKKIAKIAKGRALSSRDLIEGNYPVIAGGKTSPYSHNEYTHKNIITVSASGAYAGYVSYHPYKIWASDCSVIEAREQNKQLFIFYVLEHQQQRVYSLQSGGAQPHVYPKDLDSLKVAAPPTVEEQQKITTVLAAADNEITQLQQKLDQLKQEKKALMQQLLTGKRRVCIKGFK